MHTLCAAFRRLFRYFSPQACIKSGIIHYLCNATAPLPAGSGHAPARRTGRTAGRNGPSRRAKRPGRGRKTARPRNSLAAKGLQDGPDGGAAAHKKPQR